MKKESRFPILKWMFIPQNKRTRYHKKSVLKPFLVQAFLIKAKADCFKIIERNIFRTDLSLT